MHYLINSEPIDQTNITNYFPINRRLVIILFKKFFAWKNETIHFFISILFSLVVAFGYALYIVNNMNSGKRHNFDKVHISTNIYVYLSISGEHVQNGDHSDAHVSTFSHSSKEVRSY